jgi:hypothetical protein
MGKVDPFGGTALSVLRPLSAAQRPDYSKPMHPLQNPYDTCAANPALS